jgi:AcrR family transcriptional regulator
MPLRPLTVQSRRPRADAERNRVAILDAAQRLFAERPPDEVSMDEIALAAGVGKPTLYRRFGDRAGLVRALLHANETTLQNEILRGPPPLGPGAPPVDRLAAFMQAYIDHVGENLAVMRAGEQARQGRRYDGLYESYRQHGLMLAREARPDEPDGAETEYVVDCLLGALSPELYAAQRRRGLEHAEIRAAAGALARRLLG